MGRRLIKITIMSLISIFLLFSCDNNQKESVTRKISVWDGSSTYDWYLNAGGESGFLYKIESASDLAGFADIVNGYVDDPRFEKGFHDNFHQRLVVLETDIDLANHYWTPIGDGSGMITGILDPDNENGKVNYRFSGTFGGQDHIIYNLNNNGYIPNHDKCYKVADSYAEGEKNLAGETLKEITENYYYFSYGLFGLVRQGSIFRVHLYDANIVFDEPITVTRDGVEYKYFCNTLGGIVAQARFSFSIIGCHVNRKSNLINSVPDENRDVQSTIGGIVGRIGGKEINANSDLVVSSCLSDANMFDQDSVGGIIGTISYASSVSLSNVAFDGVARAGNLGGAGGIIGYSSKDSTVGNEASTRRVILNKINVTGEIIGPRYAGGVVGRTATQNFSLEKAYINPRKFESVNTSALVFGFLSTNSKISISEFSSNYEEGDERLHPHKSHIEKPYTRYIGGFPKKEEEDNAYTEDPISAFNLIVTDENDDEILNYSYPEKEVEYEKK